MVISRGRFCNLSNVITKNASNSVFPLACREYSITKLQGFLFSNYVSKNEFKYYGRHKNCRTLTDIGTTIKEHVSMPDRPGSR